MFPPIASIRTQCEYFRQIHSSNRRNKQSTQRVRNAKHHVLLMYIRDQQHVDYSNIIWLLQHHHLSTTVNNLFAKVYLHHLPRLRILLLQQHHLSKYFYNLLTEVYLHNFPLVLQLHCRMITHWCTVCFYTASH